jgi:hypothetical protein
MLGDSRGRKLQQLGNLADAQPATSQCDESPDTAFVCQSIGNGKYFPHGFSSTVISPYNEIYSGIILLVKRVLGAGLETAADKREQSDRHRRDRMTVRQGPGRAQAVKSEALAGLSGSEYY